MAEIVEDRVKESSTSSGTGSFTLDGALLGYRPFSEVCSIGDTFYGCIVGVWPSGQFTGEWEIGHYTYSNADTITRTRVDSSSNNDELVPFSTGLKHVFIEFTAAQIKRINSVNTVDPASMPAVPDTAPYTSMSFEADFTGSVVESSKFNTRIWHDVDNDNKNFKVANGALYIWPEKDATGVFFNRTLDTDGKYYQRYGFFEIEAMLPVGYGVLPTFWLLNRDGDARPEIDVMQAYPGGANNGAAEWGNTQNQPTNYRGMVYDGTVLGITKLATLLGPRNDLHTKFHKYGMHWSPTEIKFYFDGQLLGPAISIVNKPELQKRMYMILSLWTGGASGDWNAVPAGVAAPSNGDENNAFRINYLRTWRLKDVPIQTDETPPMEVEDPTAPTPAPSADTIIYHGDSTVWGSDGAALNDGATRVARPVHVSFAEALPNAPAYRVVNEGVPGNTWKKLWDGTDGVHSNWSSWLSTGSGKDAKFIIVNCGLNDAYVPGNTPSATVAYFNQMVDATVAAGKTFILETPNERDDNGVDAFRLALVAAAGTKGVAVIDQYTFTRDYRISHGFTIYQMCPDGYHPNQATYDLKGGFAAQRFVEITTGASPTPSPVPDPSPPPAPTPSPSRSIRGPDPSLFGTTPKFFDDFDGTTLSNRWNRGVWYAGPPPSDTWRVANSCLEFCLQSNSMFTGANDTAYSHVDTDPNSRISNGFSQKFGCLQAEMKLPIGKGTWPAFWWFGHPDNHRPEIDILEAYAGGPGDWSSNDRAPHPLRADVTIHPLDDPGGYQGSVVNFTWPSVDFSAAFHTYTCVWDQDYMEFYFDGQLTRRVTTASTMAYFARFPLYIIFDLGVNYAVTGGPSSDTSITPTGFGSDPNNPPPNVFRISYVSCWQFKKYGG